MHRYANHCPLRNARDVDNYLARLARIALVLDEGIGVAERRAANAVTQAEQVVRTSVRPAFERVRDLLNRQLAQASDAAGLWHQPGGAAAYLAMLHSNTTTGLSPEQIHAIGLKEVARIEAQMNGVLRTLGYTEGSVSDRYKALEKKFHAWSDGEGELSDRFDIDELLTNLSVYWFSGNVGATLRIYKENGREPLRFDPGERIIPPLCFARFPPEIVTPPRESVERVYDVVRWSDMPRGGHFAALEQPALLARDIHQSFDPYR